MTVRISVQTITNTVGGTRPWGKVFLDDCSVSDRGQKRKEKSTEGRSVIFFQLATLDDLKSVSKGKYNLLVNRVKIELSWTDQMYVLYGYRGTTKTFIRDGVVATAAKWKGIESIRYSFQKQK